MTNLYAGLHRCHCQAAENLRIHERWRRVRGLDPSKAGSDVRWRTLNERVRLTRELMENLEEGNPQHTWPV